MGRVLVGRLIVGRLIVGRLIEGRLSVGRLSVGRLIVGRVNGCPLRLASIYEMLKQSTILSNLNCSLKFSPNSGLVIIPVT